VHIVLVNDVENSEGGSIEGLDVTVVESVLNGRNYSMSDH